MIIYEDSDKPLGALFYSGYFDRLKLVRCKKIVYEYSKERVPLNKKWIWMGENSDPNSVGLILQASDCYSEPNRIETAYAAFCNGYDWIQTNIGCFYNIKTKQMMLYNDDQYTSLNMAVSMSQIRSMPKNEDRWSSVDYWLYVHLNEPKIFIDESENWKNGVDTDGYSRLSVNRKNQYQNPKHPFYPTDININSILPGEIFLILK